MTTVQIVIFCLLGSFDIYLAISHMRLMQITDGYVRSNNLFIFHLVRFLFTWGIVIVTTFEMNRLSSPNPCPQLEKVENVYKLK